MGLFLNKLDPKYHLLERPKNEYKCVAHSWVIFGLVALLLSATIILLFVIWDQVSQVQQDSEELDFVLFGPNKETSDMIKVSEFRALMYALDNNNTTNHVRYTSLSEKKRFNTLEHIEKPNPYLLVCYYVVPNRSSNSNKLYPSTIDANMCTHIIISFATIHNNTVSLPSEHEAKVFEDLVALKKNNTGLKILLSVISFTSGEDTFGKMAASFRTRKTFISSVLHVLKTYSLDGIDIDWEFPSWPTTKDPNQKHQLVELLKEMRDALGNESLITLAVAAPVTIIQRAYDIPKIAEYVDFVNVMCYDYHAFVWYLPFTGPNAPLYKSQSDSGYLGTLNTNYTIYYWLHQGMPKDKIMVGIPTYGHSWTLVYRAVHSYGALAKGFGSVGDKGFVSQGDICNFVSLQDTVVVFDGDTSVPYAYRQNDWISYDNPKSVAYKAELVTEMGLGGAMVYSLNQDDFDGNGCQKGRFPLTNMVKLVLKDDNL